MLTCHTGHSLKSSTTLTTYSHAVILEKPLYLHLLEITQKPRSLPQQAINPITANAHPSIDRPYIRIPPLCSRRRDTVAKQHVIRGSLDRHGGGIREIDHDCTNIGMDVSQS